jgi:hypothetical protein
MKITVIIFSTLVIMILLSTCYYDSQEYLFPTIGQCDTTGTIHFTSVDTVLQSNCVTCHNKSVHQGGVILDGYENVHFWATTPKLENDTTSFLLGAVRKMNGFTPMPEPPLPSLDKCSIRKIEMWIEQGALDN